MPLVPVLDAGAIYRRYMDLSILTCVNSTIDTSQSRSTLIGSANVRRNLSFVVSELMMNEIIGRNLRGVNVFYPLQTSKS